MKSKTPAQTAQHYLDFAVVNGFVQQVKRYLKSDKEEVKLVADEMYKLMSPKQQSLADGLLASLAMSGKLGETLLD